MDTAQIIRILDADKGAFDKQPLQGQGATSLNEALIPYPRDGRGAMTVNPELALQEAATGGLTTYNFPDALRQGIQFDVFSGYNETPTTYGSFCQVTTSTKQQEEYLKDAGLGIAPVVNEGEDYPAAAVDLNDGVIIRNYKRGFTVPVTEEMRRFDQLGKVRDLAYNMGRSLRITEEYAVMAVLTTTANYTRNSTTKDNDGGANTQNLQFTPANLVTAWNILTTMKDRKSGMYLGVRPNTLIVAPKLIWAVEQLIRSRMVIRVGGSNTNEVYGTGDVNPFFGFVDTIITSPYFGSSYEWALLERGRSIVFQRVDPVQVLPPQFKQENDTWHYRGRTWFGVGMKDDRYAFFSNSTTPPAAS